MNIYSYRKDNHLNFSHWIPLVFKSPVLPAAYTHTLRSAFELLLTHYSAYTLGPI